MKKLLLYCLFAWLTVHAMAVSPYCFQRFGVSNGLSGGAVYAICRDSRGFMWFGTSSGLDRYDGHSVRTFRHQPGDSTSLPGFAVNTIVEAPDGDLWIKTDQGFSLMNRQKGTFEHHARSLMREIGSNGTPEEVFVDEAGNTWLYVLGEGCWKIDSTRQVSIIRIDDGTLPGTFITDIKACRDGIVFIYDCGTIVCVDPQTLRHKWRLTELNEGRKEREYIRFSLFIDSEELMWIYSTESVYVYDLRDKTWRNNMTAHWNAIENCIIHAVSEDMDGRIWLGKDANGIDVYDKRTGDIVNLQFDPLDQSSIAHNTIYTITHDEEGLMWVGTYKNGISCCMGTPTGQEMHPIDDVTCVVNADSTSVWCGTNGRGIRLWDFNTQTEKHFAQRNVTDQYAIVCLHTASDGTLWAGTFNGGLYGIKGNKVTHHYNPAPENTLAPTSKVIANNNIWAISEDRDGGLWLGLLGGGLQRFDPKTGVFETYNKLNSDLPDNFLASLSMTDDGSILAVGLANHGFIFMDVDDRVFFSPSFDPNDKNAKTMPKSHSGVNQLFFDSRGLLWIASRGGLAVYDSRRSNLITFETVGADGFIAAITEDEQHNMWVTTPRRVIHIEVMANTHNMPEGDQTSSYYYKCHFYSERDGLQNDEFNQRSITKLMDGRIAMGGLYGLNIFNPHNLSRARKAPDAFYSTLRIMGKEVTDKDLNETRELTLHYNQKIFSIALAANQYASGAKNQFKYKLEGFSEEWIMLPENMNTITFTNLTPGDYLLHVKAVNDFGQESEQCAEMKLTILPPWWWSWWALCIYGCIIIAIIIGFWQWSVSREREKFRMKQIEAEIQRNAEMNQMKFQFYTNVSHELRTPLSLILAPIESLLQEITNDTQHQQLKVMERNANRLLALVNQLLDFRKAEEGGHHLHLNEADIIAYLRTVCNNFLDMANKKHINFSFFTTQNLLNMMFDGDKVGKIVTNLLGNAFKFTPDGGNVSVLVETARGEQYKPDWLVIKVSDNGIGIGDEEKKHIFERFYQIKSKNNDANGGSGIGLSLVYDFVKLHDGEVSLYDNIGGGTVFIVKLPIVKNQVKSSEQPTELPTGQTEGQPTAAETTGEATIAAAPAEDQQPKPLKHGCPNLLIVDDNEDFREFLCGNFETTYNVRSAGDGNEALKMMETFAPDVVVSDIMMPNMDGYELCKKIRENIQTKHIPVLLLSARQTEDDKVEGLKFGADDYVTKPFNMKELSLRIHRLVEDSRIRQRTPQKIDPKPSDIKITPRDEQFVQRATDYVEVNMSKTSLSVEELSRELGMSRVLLYKKLLQLTGKTPIEFIRIIRLKRAAQLLRESQMHISEIAYEVGFNNPKYFSRYFKDEFGMLPSAYQEKAEKEERSGHEREPNQTER